MVDYPEGSRRNGGRGGVYQNKWRIPGIYLAYPWWTLGVYPIESPHWASSGRTGGCRRRNSGRNAGKCPECVNLYHRKRTEPVLASDSPSRCLRPAPDLTPPKKSRILEDFYRCPNPAKPHVFHIMLAHRLLEGQSNHESSHLRPRLYS